MRLARLRQYVKTIPGVKFEVFIQLEARCLTLINVLSIVDMTMSQLFMLVLLG